MAELIKCLRCGTKSITENSVDFTCLKCKRKFKINPINIIESGSYRKMSESLFNLNVNNADVDLNVFLKS